jgi:SpoVK/Ycf46/Vps4 family AAA+-type ATPase
MLENLAQRVNANATWDNLILPEPEMRLLRKIASAVILRAGITALFTGARASGKSMAAEVLASHLRRDLYRVDLSIVINKPIGETEKNLRRLFEAAEQDGAILLFDEVDALFGKRSEVKDSHDRYANLVLNYLLQRMEEYRGLSILAIKHQECLDSRLLRRIDFIVQFPSRASSRKSEA